MRKSLLIICFLAFSQALSAQVGPSVTYEKFMQAAPPLTQAGVLKTDASLRAGRWSIGCECLDRDHYSPNNSTRTYSLPVWDSPVFLLERGEAAASSVRDSWEEEW